MPGRRQARVRADHLRITFGKAFSSEIPRVMTFTAISTWRTPPHGLGTSPT
jgi:hypothetical protein